MTQPNDPIAAEDPRSLGEIVGDIANDLSTMVRSELDLAKTEAKREISKAGKSAGMLGAAAISAYLMLFFLSLFVMYLLSNAMDIEWAALIVTIIWAIAAASLAMVGRKKMQEVDLQLETTQRTLKEDAQWVKNQK